MAIKIPKADPDDTTIRLGGLFAPGYVEAYMAAWKELLPNARALAIPILFLQRHTLELIVKDVIHDLLITREEIRLGHEVFGLPARADVVDPDTWQTQWTRLHKEHGFKRLFRDLAKNLKLLELPDLPPEYNKAKELIHSVDRGNGTRFRYDTDWKRQPSFGVSKRPIAPIRELEPLLETIIAVHSPVSERGEEPVSFRDHIYQHWVDVNHDVGAAVRRLEERTRNGAVVWNPSRNPPLTLNTHELIESRDVDASYLVAQDEGREFVILRIRPDNGYSDYLACRDGERLSPLLWPFEYHSNLTFAARESAEEA
jgi:hypothetical protein